MPHEAFALRRPRRALKPHGIAEVGMQRLDRIDTGRFRRKKAERAHDLVGEQKLAVRVAIGGGAERAA